MGRKERTWIQTPRLLPFTSCQRTVYTCIWQHAIKQQNKYLPHRLSLPESLTEHNGLSHWRVDKQHVPQSPSIIPCLNSLWKKALRLGLRTSETTRLLKGEIEKLQRAFLEEKSVNFRQGTCKSTKSEDKLLVVWNCTSTASQRFKRGSIGKVAWMIQQKVISISVFQLSVAALLSQHITGFGCRWASYHFRSDAPEHISPRKSWIYRSSAWGIFPLHGE